MLMLGRGFTGLHQEQGGNCSPTHWARTGMSVNGVRGWIPTLLMLMIVASCLEINPGCLIITRQCLYVFK